MLWANRRIRFVLTAECNIDCFYCHNEGQPKSEIYFSEKLFQHILKIIESNTDPIESVTFTGGEPLLHPKLDYFISTISRFSPKITMVTNGLLLTRERLIGLKDSGLTKIRLGVDSFSHDCSRPSILKKNDRPIMEVIELITNSNINFELNSVLTKYNRKDIPVILKFCKEHPISAKFFEMVDVEQLPDNANTLQMIPMPQVPFSEFETVATSILKNCKYFIDEKMNGANYVFECNDFQIRYCKYLCDYNMCYKTGTRIDPSGAVYACMGRRGGFWINCNDPIQVSERTISNAVDAGCISKRAAQNDK